MPRRPNYAGNYIPGLIAEGLSANAAYRKLGDLGLSLRRQTFLRAWGETVDALAKRETVEQTNVSRRPLAEEVTSFTAPRATGYLYQVDVLIRDRLTNEVYFTPSGYRSQRLVPYQEALQGAIDALAQAQIESERGTPLGQLVGGIVTQVREFVPEDEGESF